MTKKYLLTQEGLAKLNDELKALITEKRPGVIERIREAAAHGDLSENADYAQAREEQSFIEGRISGSLRQAQGPRMTLRVIISSCFLPTIVTHFWQLAQLRHDLHHQLPLTP